MVNVVMWAAGSRGTRRVVGLPFSSPLARDDLGWLGAEVLPLRVVRRQSLHANGFCARLPHHQPSTILAMSVDDGYRLRADLQISRQRSSRYYGFALERLSSGAARARRAEGTGKRCLPAVSCNVGLGPTIAFIPSSTPWPNYLGSIRIHQCRTPPLAQAKMGLPSAVCR